MSIVYNVKNLEDLLKSGVYKILNNTTQKFYIGSTTMTLQKRLWHHISQLRVNKHKNSYLQNSWNKYGEKDFSIEIIEITEKENCLKREQYWIDYYKNLNQITFNINPLASGTPNLSQETIDKRSKSFKIFQKECSRLYKLFKNKQLKIDDIPEKYKKMITSWSSEITNEGYFNKGHISWNTGLTKNDIDYSYLKVPKTITQKVKDKIKLQSKRIRENSSEIFVYTLNKHFLGKWDCSKDLEEWSLTDENNLPIKSRFKGERMNKPVRLLQSVSINKSCNFNKPYKGLLFSYKPLHQAIDVEKLDKLLEKPVEVNQQPITPLTKCAGSTTRY